MYKGTIETGMLVNYRMQGWRKPRELTVTRMDKKSIFGTPTPNDVAALVKEFPTAQGLATKGVLSAEMQIYRGGIVSATPRLSE